MISERVILALQSENYALLGQVPRRGMCGGCSGVVVPAPLVASRA
jgi:hypothetical protein